MLHGDFERRDKRVRRECAVRLRRAADAGMDKGLRMRYRPKDNVLAVLQILPPA
jgi:hypothetical protein